MPEIDPGDFSRAALERAGFVGWVPFDVLPAQNVPTTGGVYVVLRTSTGPVAFLDVSPAGSHKGKSATVALALLEAAWPGTPVVYIGKATSLCDRLNAFRRQGIGRKAGHFGGRYIWQLADSAMLLVAWRVTIGVPRLVEKELLKAFEDQYHALAFGNRNR